MKVLVIDDEEVVRRSLVRAVKSMGHDPFEASDGESAIDVWLEVKPDLVFLDVLMPGLSGPQVLQELGQRRGDTRVVLISAYSGEFDLEKAKSDGADLFIPKPFPDIFDVINKGVELVGG